MKRPKRRIRTFAKTAPKTKEKKLIENAKKLAEDPFILLPTCKDKGAEKVIIKVRKRIEKVWKNRNDIKKLERLANKKGIEGAVAGTLMLIHSEKAPYLASARIGNRDIMYALRGKTRKELLIAVQNFDDPILRLLGFRELAMKNKICLYSWDDGFVCSRDDGKPPEDFNKFVFDKIELRFEKDIAHCPHIDKKKLRDGEPDKEDYLRIEWKNIVIGVCRSCANKSNKNTLFEMSKYFIDPNIGDTSVKIVSRLPELKGEIDELNDYLYGKITDAQLLSKTIEKWKKKLKSSDRRILIADGKSYDNVEEFIDSLKPNRYEKIGLEFMLSKTNESMIVENESPNRILERYWEDYGKELIYSIVEDNELTNELLSMDERPSKIIEIAVRISERKRKLSQYPQYKNLPTTAKFVDDLAKNYLLFGGKKVLSLLSKPPKETKKRSIAYAFLLALGKGEERKWQYSKIEIEYGDFLKEYVEKLINSDPENYDKALRELLQACGSNEKIE